MHLRYCLATSLATAGLSAAVSIASAQGTYGAEPIPGVRSGGSKNIAADPHQSSTASILAAAAFFL